MAEETPVAANPTPAQPASPVVQAAAPSAAPAAPAPAPAETASAPAAPARTEAPPATPAAQVAAPTPAPAEAPKPAAPTTPVSLLGEAGKPAPEPAKAETAPAITEPPPEEAPAPVYEKFNVPEGATLDDERLGQFTKVLGEFKAPQELGQKLVDFHVAEIQRLRDQALTQQYEVFNNTRAEWVDKVKSDPELGGNRFQTALTTTGRVIEQYGGTAEQIAELRAALNFTGAGDHPAIFRLLHNVGKVLSEGRPVAAAKPMPAPVSKAARRYATNGAAS